MFSPESIALYELQRCFDPTCPKIFFWRFKQSNLINEILHQKGVRQSRATFYQKAAYAAGRQLMQRIRCQLVV